MNVNLIKLKFVNLKVYQYRDQITADSKYMKCKS